MRHPKLQGSPLIREYPMAFKISWSRLNMILAIIASACGGSLTNAQTVVTPTPISTTPATAATALPGNLDTVTFIQDNQEYTIAQLLPRDGIRPIYDPQFTSAEDSRYSPDELVMGVEINGDARAYSVGILRSREMVNDTIGGVPVLVTW